MHPQSKAQAVIKLKMQHSLFFSSKFLQNCQHVGSINGLTVFKVCTKMFSHTNGVLLRNGGSKKCV